MRILVLLSLFAAVSVASPVDQAFERLYKFDFTGAHRIIDAHVMSEPADPLSYAVRASALLFQELDRLQILEGEFFSDELSRYFPENPLFRKELQKVVSQRIR
jgi:hypothetical protein